MRLANQRGPVAELYRKEQHLLTDLAVGTGGELAVGVGPAGGGGDAAPALERLGHAADHVTMQDGVAGIGSTVSAALRAFDIQYANSLKPPRG